MPDGTNTSSPYLGGQPGHHAIERAWERYGLRLTQADLAALAADCESGRAPMLRRDGKHEMGSVHMAKVAGIVILVAYRAGTIVTVLPYEKIRVRNLTVTSDTQPRSTGRGGKRYKSRRRGPKRRSGNDRWDEGD